MLQTFRSRNWEKTRLKLQFSSCHNVKIVVLWLILKWYTILEDFFLLDSVHYHDDVKTTVKVWLVQSQDPDVKVISQIDIVMCFIYNISAMSWNMVVLWLILKWYIILVDFFLLDSVHYHDDVKTILKVWLVRSQDPDVRLISQIDIVMCFIYNISAMSWRYQRWCHSNIVTISECPLGSC